jgi:nucleoside-diphosphate-sugar epimerase
MHILITGAAGMIGRKLVERLRRDGRLAGKPIEKMTLVDIANPGLSGGGSATEFRSDDISVSGVAEPLVEQRPELIVHLSAVVSGEAELEFEKGYRVNLDGTRFLLEAVRKIGGGYRPRFVFASSYAVFGAPFPQTIPSDFNLTPLTSYGTQKVIGEQLLADYSRRGFVDGIGLRFPAICVRPGAPNKAASGFFSSIIREPLVGKEAILPVAETVLHTHASPRAAVNFLVHAATMDTDGLGAHRSLSMPGVSVTVGEQIAALGRAAGESAVRLIKRRPDSLIAWIVSGWPERVDASRATKLGFVAETSFDQIIRVHIEDELGGATARTQTQPGG